MEIERKFLVDKIPADLEKYSHKELEQGYPVQRAGGSSAPGGRSVCAYLQV